MADLVGVEIPCVCPGTPHKSGDTVQLKPKLSLMGGAIVQGVVVAANRKANEEGRPLDAGMATALIAEQYLLHGVHSWSLVDQLGKPLPVHADTIRSALLDDFSVGSIVAEKADALYMEAVIAPLLAPASNSSPPRPITGSTSATTSESTTPKPRKRSRPSSTSTTQTDDTETTTSSPGGVFSTSPSETSAAA